MQKFSDTKSWLPDIKNMMGNIPSWVGGAPQPKQGWNKFSDFLGVAKRQMDSANRIKVRVVVCTIPITV